MDDLGRSVATARDETENGNNYSIPECKDPTCVLGHHYNPDAPKGRRNPPCPLNEKSRK